MYDSKVVVITGAASGIGKAMASEYLQNGYEVIGVDINAEALDQLAKTYSTFHSMPADVTKESELMTVAQKAKEKFERVDIWINNAGLAKLGNFEELDKNFEKVMAVNFNGVLYGMRAALSLMEEPAQGKIVNISSMAGDLNAPFMSSYCASKHAVSALTRSMQLEFKVREIGIQLILVTPGFVQTPIMEQENFPIPGWLKPMLGKPESVAKEIIAGIEKGKKEIVPTFNGKVLNAMDKLSPGVTRRASRFIGASNWKEFLGLSPIKK